MSPIFNYQKDGQTLFRGLNDRQKEIVSRRFGLASGQKQTLQEIGRDFGLTRERVRQIIENSLARIRQDLNPAAKRLLPSLKQHLQKAGGLQREASLFKESAFDAQANAANWLAFFLALDKDFVHAVETDKFFAFWALNKAAVDRLNKTVASAEKILQKEKKVLSLNQILSQLPERPAAQLLKSSLEIAKDILETNSGYGLADWPEINPKGIRDLAWLVLKQFKKPLHFTEIAKLIDGFSLRQKEVDSFTVVSAGAGVRKTNRQTVHNELIKDPQFVLVGRGIYALGEWGFKPGTVKEIISQTMKKAQKPLSEKDILKNVLSQRLVKESTVLLNLGDRKCFLKSSDGRYSLREA